MERIFLFFNGALATDISCMYVMLIRSRFCCSGLVRGHDVAGVWVDAVLAVQAEGGDLDLEGGPVGSLEFQVTPEKKPAGY